jgi:hypothetical protein
MIWEFERKRRGLEPGEIVGDTWPRLPDSSPWHSGIDQTTGPEELIDRSEDANHD